MAAGRQAGKIGCQRCDLRQMHSAAAHTRTHSGCCNFLRRVNGTVRAIRKGQLTCFDSQGGRVAIKFGSGPVLHYRCSRTADGRADVIFSEPVPQVLRQLQAFEQITVEVQFFQAGREQLTFRMAGSKW